MREGILQDNIYKRAVEKNISKKNKCDESIGNISISSSATYRDVEKNVSASAADSRQSASDTNIEKSSSDGFYFCVFALIEAVNNLRIRAAEGQIYTKVNIIIPEHYTENDLKSIILSLNDCLTLANVKIARCMVNVWSCVTSPIMNVEAFLTDAADVKEAVKKISLKSKKSSEQHTSAGAADGNACDKNSADGMLSIVAFGEVGISYTKATLNDETVMESCKKRFSNEYISDMDYDYGAMLINLSKDVIDNSRLIINSSECGINGALWKLAEMSDCGFEVDYKAIPVKQSVVELSELLKRDIYNMHSLGSGIILTDNPDEIVNKLKELGINAAQIGALTKEKSKIILGVDTRSNMNRPDMDEIYVI